MKISLLVIGKIKEKWMRMGIGEYEKRLKPFLKMELIEHEEEKMPGNLSPAIKEQIMEKEGDKLLKAVSGYGRDSFFFGRIGCVAAEQDGAGDESLLFHDWRSLRKWREYKEKSRFKNFYRLNDFYSPNGKVDFI